MMINPSPDNPVPTSAVPPNPPNNSNVVQQQSAIPVSKISDYIIGNSTLYFLFTRSQFSSRSHFRWGSLRESEIGNPCGKWWKRCLEDPGEKAFGPRGRPRTDTTGDQNPSGIETSKHYPTLRGSSQTYQPFLLFDNLLTCGLLL